MAPGSHRTQQGLSRSTVLILVAILVIVMALPLVLARGARFGGTDDAGAEAVAAMVPGFQPWIEPLWRPPSSETESMLFALQAAAGAAIIGYVVGLNRGRAERRDRSAPDRREEDQCD
ncbi:MAG TPA: energy-coupling factor ABC transporter substrate-binding protein [Chloroflexota bacterium]